MLHSQRTIWRVSLLPLCVSEEFIGITVGTLYSRRTSSILRLATSEFVSEPHAKYPRSRDGLRCNELRARGVYALDHIGEVLGIQFRRPCILRDTDGCVVLRECGIFKPEVRRAH